MNCRNYGTQVLSHPLIVDAVEHSFIPACVYNNSKGDADERVLKRFREPAWNNPVVRIIDPEGQLIVARIQGDWTLPTLARSMVSALENRKATVPPYLQVLAQEETARVGGAKAAVFGMG